MIPTNESTSILIDFARRDPDGMSRTVVVLTAGTQNTGAIDPLKDAMKGLAHLGLSPAWWHVDASWAGPSGVLVALSRFAQRHRRCGFGHRVDSQANVPICLVGSEMQSGRMRFWSSPDGNNTTQISCWDRGLTDRWRLCCCCLPWPRRTCELAGNGHWQRTVAEGVTRPRRC